MLKVSVILPVYNSAEYLNDCIKCLCAQTLKEIEIIFVDDCSPDNSSEIIKSYNDTRIKLFKHDVNKYIGAARNTGIEHASGEYLYFMDPDDYIEPDFLEKLYTLAKKQNADIAKGVYRNNFTGRIINKNKMINYNKFNFHFTLWTAIYKKALIDKHNIRFKLDVICGQLPMIYYANKVVTCDTAIYTYITRPNSIINSGFTIEKWQRLNITNTQIILDFINTHELSKTDYILLVRKLLFKLYVYGYKRLSSIDKQTAKPLLEKYLDDCWNKLKYKTNIRLKKAYLELRSKYV